MPKMPKPSMQFVVSFNCDWDQEYGDTSVHSVDHQGDDVESLAEEVCASDPSFPLTFERNPDADSDTIGWFLSVETDPVDVYKVAVMVNRSAFCG